MTEAQRNVWLLVAAQSLGAAAPPILISLGGLVGQMLSGSAALATLPVSLITWVWRCPRFRPRC